MSRENIEGAWLGSSGVGEEGLGLAREVPAGNYGPTGDSTSTTITTALLHPNSLPVREHNANSPLVSVMRLVVHPSKQHVSVPLNLPPIRAYSSYPSTTTNHLP